MVQVETLDALIAGAGFSGLHLLQKLRELKFNVKICEAGTGIGGTWYWNRYPGARVDSECSNYQFSQFDVQDFTWTERFPGQPELERYFKHVDSKLNLSKDIRFETRVTSAEFNGSTNQWNIKVNNSEEVSIKASFLLLCVGSFDHRYTPPFKGIDKFKGISLHTGVWPKNGIDVSGKRVAVIGTGASGVQTIQEIGPQVAHLTVYQRTPNMALPMQQSSLADHTGWASPSVDELQGIFSKLRTTFPGFDYGFLPSKYADATAEEKELLFEDLYKQGGFRFWLAGYQEILLNQEANDEAYQFWRKKTRSRINDPVKQEMLAPTIAPHPFGTKRPSLEQRYYEVYNQDNVDLIDVRKSPIVEITENGVRTEKEGVVDVDIIVYATGFDAQTGGILNISMTNDRNETIQDKWKNGVLSNIGMATAGYPNMFFLYGPQAPTALSNGPTCAELQGEWIVELLINMRANDKTKIETTNEAELKWKQIVNNIWKESLFPLTDSWYQGANIPGKPREALNFAGGIPAYLSILNECAANNYEGFVLS